MELSYAELLITLVFFDFVMSAWEVGKGSCFSSNFYSYTFINH